MCKQCHSMFTDEEVVEQLTDHMDNPQYEKWNTTSVSHIGIAASGHNGNDARKLGLILFRNYIDWRKTQSEIYMPETGIETMYSVYDLERMYEHVEQQKDLSDYVIRDKPTIKWCNNKNESYCVIL